MSFYANAIIGIEIDPEKILPDRLVRTCGCSKKKVTQDMKFCPTCGGKAWRKEENPIEGYDEGESDTDGEAMLFGIELMHIRGYDEIDRDHYKVIQTFAIGVKVAHGDLCYDNNFPEMISLPENLSEIKNRLKEALEPHGFWDESKFGLWAVGRAC